VIRRLRSLLRRGRDLAVSEPLTWMLPGGVAACRYPRDDDALLLLAAHDVRLIINLHERPHRSDGLDEYGLRQLHVPVRDYTPPSQPQIAEAIAAIDDAVARGERVAVHCGAGLGRTGTLIACVFVSRGMAAPDAIAHVRALRPGSVETPEQEAAVRAYAAALSHNHTTPTGDQQPADQQTSNQHQQQTSNQP
jgi:atypical dual specificity phosphatase